MEAKLRQLMKHEGINSTRLAEILGIQASGISHIMSGRNKPSFDFLHKLLQRFPQINPDWLLLDKGPMYRDEIKNKGGQTSISTGTGNRPGGSGNIADSGNTGNSDNMGGSGGYRGDRLGGDVGGGAINASDGIGGVGVHDRGAVGSPVDNTAGRISAGDRHGAMVSDVDSPYRRGETVVHNDRNGSGSERNRPSGGSSGGLFGPDNNDIIPSSDSSGGPVYGARSGNLDGARPGQYQAAGRAGAAAPHSAHTPAQAGYASEGQVFGGQPGQPGQPVAGHAQGWLTGEASGGSGDGRQLPRQATRHDTQQEDYQSNILRRSASIERIVVFYKDKTFSEYQPE